MYYSIDNESRFLAEAPSGYLPFIMRSKSGLRIALAQEI